MSAPAQPPELNTGELFAAPAGPECSSSSSAAPAGSFTASPARPGTLTYARPPTTRTSNAWVALERVDAVRRLRPELGPVSRAGDIDVLMWSTASGYGEPPAVALPSAF